MLKYFFQLIVRVFVAVLLFCTAVAADVFSFSDVKFLGERNGGAGKWTQLRFSITDPRVGAYTYEYGRKFVQFTIDTDMTDRFTRSDIGFTKDWLKSGYFLSTKKRWMYLGSGRLNSVQLNDLNALQPNEKAMAAWIIANSDELIEYALNANKKMSASARSQWLKMKRGGLFESRIRKNLGVYFRKNLKEYDDHAKHQRLALIRMIQPSLKKLGYYKGTIDGLWGKQTKSAIMTFERRNGLFPDGVNYGEERKLLKQKADEHDKYQDISEIKRREEKNRNDKLALELKLLQANQELLNLKNESTRDKAAIASLTNRVSELKRSNLSKPKVEELEKKLEQALNKAEFQSSLARKRLSSLRESRKKLAELDNIKVTNTDLIEANQEIINLKNEAARNKAAIARLTNRVSELKRSNLSKPKVEELEKKLEQALNKAEFQSSLARKRLSSLRESRKKLAELEKTTKPNNEFAVLQSDFQEATDLLNRRNKEILDLNNLILELTNQSVSTEKFSEVEQELERVDSELRELTKLYDDRDSKLTILKQQSIVNKSKMTSLAIENTELRRKVEDFNKREADAASISSALESKVAELNAQIEEMRSKGNAENLQPIFKLSEEWLDVERYLAVQQVRFCQILSNYSLEAKEAAESKNQLRQNMVATNRDNDIAALLPNGDYKDWVVKVVEIYATPSGDAAFVLKLPCDVTFGSGQLSGAEDLEGVYAATAEFGGLIYNQLAQLSQDDTVLISGKILTYDDLGKLNTQLKFVTSLSGDKTLKSQRNKAKAAPDYFSSINYLSKL